jgi:two-component system chemotaxis sensor kinase CheA
LFKRTVRDIARENKKEVNFEVEGGRLEADITLLNRLREPFIHIIRNSVAHGIETPDERVKIGKDRVGTIRLKADRVKDSLYMSISDDGKGIDKDNIIKFLKEKKEFNDTAIAKMSDENIFETIISPEYSSAQETSQTAGRGVGMNLVHQTIEYLGGKMSIHSKPSQGTELIIRLPVSLFLMNCLTFKVDNYAMSIPTSMIISVDRDLPGNKGLYNLRGLMGIKDDPDKWGHTLKVLIPYKKVNDEPEEKTIAFSVDKVIGNKRIMVMPAGELLSKTGLITGVGITDNGQISVILDVESLPKSPN